MDRNNNIVRFIAKSFKDVESAIEIMKQGRAVVIMLHEADAGIDQRIMDNLAGASFALDATIYKMAEDIYMITPHGTNVVTND